jgi:hypothetical protein
MPDISTVVRALVSESRVDHVGLWEPVIRMRGLGLADDAPIMRMTLGMLLPLLSTGQIQAGQFAVNSDEFQIWEMEPKDVIARIEREWKALGRDPGPGDIVWFVDGPNWVSP